MRIGVFADSYKPYVSGVVRSIETFTQELTALGHEVYIFAPRYPHYRERSSNVFRFHSVRAPANPDFSLAIPLSARISTTMARLNLDIIHVHSPFLLGRLGVNCARRFGLPLVFTYHTLYEQYVHYVPFGQPLARELMVRMSRSFCNKCDLVITPTKKIKNLLSQYGVKTSIVVVPTGVDLTKFKSGDPSWLRDNYGIGSEEQVLLFVGRLTKEKNLDFLLEAFRLILTGVPSARLVIVATGPEEQHLKDLAENLGISDRVIFTGYLPQSQLISCYHGADLFVFPSVTETQGLVLLEAMAAGLPVVAVDAYGVSDMVSNGRDGLLVPPRVEEFAAAVGRMLQTPELRSRMAGEARLKAERMSSRQMTIRLVQAYESLLRGRDLQKPELATALELEP